MKNKTNYERGNLRLDIKGKKLGKKGSDLYIADTNELSGFYLSTLLKNDQTIMKESDNKESLILSFNSETGSDESYEDNLLDAVKLAREIANDYGVHLHVSNGIITRESNFPTKADNKNVLINNVFSKGISQPMFVHELDNVPDDFEIVIKPPRHFYTEVELKYHISQSSLKTSSQSIKSILVIPEKQNIVLDNSKAHSRMYDIYTGDNALDQKMISHVSICTLDKNGKVGFNLSNVRIKDNGLSSIYEFEYSFKNVKDCNEHYKVQFRTPKITSEGKHIFNINTVGMFYEKDDNAIYDIDFDEAEKFLKENDKYTIHLPAQTLSENVEYLTKFIIRAGHRHNNELANKKNAGDVIQKVLLYRKFGINLPDYLHNIYKLMNEQRLKIIFNPEKFHDDYFYIGEEFPNVYLKINDRDKTDFTEDYKKVMEIIIDKYIEPERKIESKLSIESTP